MIDFLRRKRRERIAAGTPDGIPCMVRHPAGAGRWRVGRVLTGPGGVRWEPRRGEPVPLPGGRATGVRPPSVKEGIFINPGSRIVTCTYGSGEPGGTIDIAVMPFDLRELLEAVPQAGQDASGP